MSKMRNNTFTSSYVVQSYRPFDWPRNRRAAGNVCLPILGVPDYGRAGDGIQSHRAAGTEKDVEITFQTQVTFQT